MFGIGRSDTGIVRCNNEDSICVLNGKIGFLDNLFIVSDGMGGHNAGGEASRKAIEFFCSFIENNGCNDVDLLDLLIDGAKYANNAVYEISLSSSLLNGMGTTFTACTIKNDKCFIVHVGDSRLYLAQNGKLEQVTYDHSYVNELVKAGQITLEQAGKHHLKNIITRALGTEENVEIDGNIINISKEDYIFLCSDGLSNMISDEHIKNIIFCDRPSNIESKVEKMIEMAKSNGGDDNISVVLIDTARDKEVAL